MSDTSGQEDLEFLLGLLPSWLEHVPKGLDPTMYGTGTYEGDLKVKKRLEEIKKRHAQKR